VVLEHPLRLEVLEHQLPLVVLEHPLRLEDLVDLYYQVLQLALVDL
jgi:hypothetical protein